MIAALVAGTVTAAGPLVLQGVAALVALGMLGVFGPPDPRRTPRL